MVIATYSNKIENGTLNKQELQKSLEELLKRHEFKIDPNASVIGAGGGLKTHISDPVKLVHAVYPQKDAKGREYESNLFVASGEDLDEIRGLIFEINNLYTDKGYNTVHINIHQ